MNDAGKELVDHPGRVEAFLDFLGAGQEDPRRGGGTLYSAHVFGEAPRKVVGVVWREVWAVIGCRGEAMDVVGWE